MNSIIADYAMRQPRCPDCSGALKFVRTEKKPDGLKQILDHYKCVRCERELSVWKNRPKHVV